MRDKPRSSDEGSEFHLIVRCVRFMSMCFVDDLVVDDIDGAPAPGSGIRFGATIRKNARGRTGGVFFQDLCGREIFFTAPIGRSALFALHATFRFPAGEFGKRIFFDGKCVVAGFTGKGWHIKWETD